MDTPTMDTIYQAISALYDNPNTSEKEKASRWLADVQKSIHSWKIADELLQQKRDLNSCYFAAQTMRSKVQHNLSELPSEAHVSLRDSLVTHLEHTSPESSASILTQLSLALADLALQMPSWQNCISDLIKSFSNKNDFALLEILTVLPQEIDSSSLKLGENRREDIKSELRTHSQSVTLFLKESISNSQNTHVALKIMKCMTSWIQVRAINLPDVPQNAVIGYSLQVLRDQNSINTLHEAASDCICALLHCLEENNNNDDIERLLFESVSALEESYHLAVAHEEDEKATNYARVFTELAETFLEKIVVSMSGGSTHFAVRSLELALVCVGHHDYEVAEITFNLWYRLSEEVYQRDYQPLTDSFKPHVERLIEALARHCQCEPDHTQLPEEGDEFYEFRSKVMGLIKDVVFIVGSSSVFRQMFAALQADISWEQTEAALFIMQSVGKNILPEEYTYVPMVVEAILSMPEGTHLAVRKTCILLLGELCEWIEKHSECLEPCLQFLIKALQDKHLAFAAATALQNICKACSVQASAHVAALMRAAQAAEALSLSPHAGAALMRALGAAIGRLPHQQLAVAMREAVALQVAGLEKLISSERPEGGSPQKGSPNDPCVWLDRLAALFRDVDVIITVGEDDHPCMPALADAWPCLQRVLEKYSGDGRVMERWCRAVRFGVRCGGRRVAALAPALCGVLRQAYSRRPHSCVLYLASVLLDELYSSSAAVPHLVALLRDVMPQAFQLLQPPQGLTDNPDTVDDLFRLCIRDVMPQAFQLLQPPQGLTDNPDTVDDLFRLCIRFLQRIPLEFLSCGALATILQCAALACCLDHRDANSSVMKFLYDFTRLANKPRTADKQQIKTLTDAALSAHGLELTSALVEASVLHLHSYMLAELAEVLLELLQWQRAAGVDWLQPALARLPRERAAAATQHQCWQFHQYAMRAEKNKEMTRLLRDFARLYR